jgi:dipeptide/tripeptide permease
MHYTYPKFGIRELGEGAPIMRLWSVNPLMIIFLVPIVGALTQRHAAYPMVVVGSSIAAAAVFIMALPTAWFQGMADGLPGRLIGHWWLGLEGPVHPYYVMVFIFIFFLSIGETIYSPRLYEYPAAIAPKGQEASYMALSFLPYFIAKFFVGMLSGLLLAKYCPAEGPRNSQLLWLIIATITVVTPIGLIVLGRFIRVKEAGREA